MNLATSEPPERVAFLYWGATGSADYPADLGLEAIAAVERVRKDGGVRDALVCGNGCLHVVCKLIERSAGTTRDSDAWLVVGPLKETDATDIARDAELIARGLQRMPQRLFKTTRLDAIPKASDSPPGWSIRRAASPPQEGRLIVLDALESTNDPQPPIREGGPDGPIPRKFVWSRLRARWPLATAFLLGFTAGVVYQRAITSKSITGVMPADPQQLNQSKPKATDGSGIPEEDPERDRKNQSASGDASTAGRVSSAGREASR